MKTENLSPAGTCIATRRLKNKGIAPGILTGIETIKGDSTKK